MIHRIPRVQSGIDELQVPEVWQVLKLDPDLLYPYLQVKEASVFTGYFPFITGGRL